MIETKVRRLGNSIGVFFPRQDAERMGIKEGEEIIIEVHRKKNVLRELFGAIRFKRKTEDILKEGKREIESKWLK